MRFKSWGWVLAAMGAAVMLAAVQGLVSKEGIAPVGEPVVSGLSPSQLQQWQQARERIAQAVADMEAASARQDPQAMAQARSAMNAAMGIGVRPTLAPSRIEALLPERLGELPRQPADVFGDDTLGASSVSVSVRYGSTAERRLDLSLSDTGGLSSWAALVEWERAARTAIAAGRRESVRWEDRRVIREVFGAPDVSPQVNVVLANGLVIEAIGDGLTLAELRAALEDLDLAALEGLQP
ncbi:MAG: hypothetical protein ACK4ZD_11215 [Caldimonas sp.]|uniref:hypothetical protein n=1 Tax=Caldimonas sp. TaxID=2838790 RepID=UPI00391A01F7